MNLHVTRGAIGVLCIQIVLWPCRLNGADAVVHAMTRQTELVDGSESQEPRIRRAVWRMTSRTSLGLERSVLESKRPLFVGVALQAPSVRTRG